MIFSLFFSPLNCLTLIRFFPFLLLFFFLFDHSNRYGLTNEDLNRRWSNPDQSLHPVIYHTKGLMEYCTRVLQRPPHVYVDYHGHSRRKNVFLFGCSRSSSWSAADRAKPDQPVQYLVRDERGIDEGIIFRLSVYSLYIDGCACFS